VKAVERAGGRTVGGEKGVDLGLCEKGEKGQEREGGFHGWNRLKYRGSMFMAFFRELYFTLTDGAAKICCFLDFSSNMDSLGLWNGSGIGAAPVR
jgi:hypothetical protein